MKTKDSIIIQKVLNKNKPKRPIVKNCIKAFLVGGIISIVSQGILDIYQKVLDIDEKLSISALSVTLVFIASLLTGLGVYDKIGQWSGAGTIIPITGFANSMTSAAIESRSEGLVLGIMTNMFKLAGAIIVSGVVSAFLFGTIIFLVR